MNQDLLLPLNALTKAQEMTLPKSWQEIAPDLAQLCETQSLQRLNYELVIGRPGELQTKQAFRWEFETNTPETLLEKTKVMTRTNGYAVQDGPGFFMAISPKQTIVCESDEKSLSIDISRTPHQVLPDDITQAVKQIPLTQSICDFLGLMRIKNFSCTKEDGQPLSFQISSRRSVEHIGADDQWLADHHFLPVKDSVALLSNETPHGTIWIMWQGEKVAIAAGKEPDFVQALKQH